MAQLADAAPVPVEEGLVRPALRRRRILFQDHEPSRYSADAKVRAQHSPAIPAPITSTFSVIDLTVRSTFGSLG